MSLHSPLTVCSSQCHLSSDLISASSISADLTAGLMELCTISTPFSLLKAASYRGGGWMGENWARRYPHWYEGVRTGT